MKLVEGTHYKRRLDQPSSVPTRAKEKVDCLICGVPSDSEDENVRSRLTNKQVNQGIRLDKLLIHYKRKHREAFLVQARSLLDKGFSVAGAALISSEANMEIEETAEAKNVGPLQHQPFTRQTKEYHVASAEKGVQLGAMFWRTLTHQVDAIIKANSTGGFIPSSHSIAEEVLRQQQTSHAEERGTGVSRER